MKKLILLAAAIAMVSAANAQMSWGFRGGLNVTNITNSEDGKFKPSIYLGGFAEWKLGNVVAVSPELYYSRQGASTSGSVDGIDFKGKIRVNYLNLPVLVKLYVTDNVSVDLGPQIGILLNSKAWAKVGGSTSTSDIPYSTNSADLSFAMGLTYNFSKIFVQGRYNIGLNNIFTNVGENNKNSVIQLGAGYRF